MNGIGLNILKIVEFLRWRFGVELNEDPRVYYF